jgi:hypothetical protein
MVAAAEGIAYGELVVYIPVFFLTLIVVFRHGFKREMGWIYLAIFCIVRIVGAIFKIEASHHPDSKTDIEWATILQSVGLSPLLMASLGLLKRIIDEVSNHIPSETSIFAMQGGLVGNIIAKRATANSRRSRIIQVTQLPTTIALILCIVGGMDAADGGSEATTGQKYTKIGAIIFLFVYVLLFVLAVITVRDVGNAPRGEKRIYWVVVMALPLLAVRLLWTLLASFLNNSMFSTLGGDIWVQLAMAIGEEFVIVVMYTMAGLTAHD